MARRLGSKTAFGRTKLLLSRGVAFGSAGASSSRFLQLVLFTFCVAASGACPALLFAQQGIWAATPLAQSNGTSVVMPRDRPLSRRSQLALTIDTRWANNYGYRAVEVDVSSPQPSKADRVITIRLHIGRNSIEQDFELPAGSTAATTVVAVPQFQTNIQYLWWDVWVDGVKDNDLSLDRRNGTWGAWSASGSGMTFLVAGPADRHRSLVAPNNQQFDVLSLTLAEFPQRWIDYTCLDVIALSMSELETLSQTNPAAFEAMQRWVRAGGQLWVSEVGSEFDRLAELSELLHLRSTVTSTTANTANEETGNGAEEVLSDGGWQPVRFGSDGSPDGQVFTFLDINTGSSRTVRDRDEVRRLQNDSNFVITSQQFEAVPEDTGRRSRSDPDSSRWFIQQRCGLGTVRAFRGANDVGLFPQRQPPADPNAVANNDDGSDGMPASLATALRAARRWDSRHGLAPDSANPDFVNLLVPGVGLAPVTEFRVLITVFVLLIGPVNYWLLRRWGRLQLLVLTVPLAAAVMTAALFAYAIVADGFGTTVRAHSFTTLDQRSGEAACWARLSYYSGLAPGQGLTMPSDTVLYPIIPTWNAGNIDPTLGRARDIVWQPGEARLTRGWLQSRSPTQYLTVRARQSPHRLELASGGGKLRATNKLGTDVEFVAVVDGEGAFWTGENLADGSVAFLQPVERAEAIRGVRQRIADNEPQVPAALTDGDSYYSMMQRRVRRQMWGRFHDNEPLLSNNLASDALAELAGFRNRPALDLPPRSYVAFTSTGPEVEFGMRGAKEEASFHVIVGQW